MGKNGFAKVRVTKKLLAIDPNSLPAQFRHAPRPVVTTSHKYRIFGSDWLSPG